jgi:hypothetical protein
MQSIRQQHPLIKPKPGQFEILDHRFKLERRFSDAYNLLKTCFEDLPVHAVHGIRTIEYRFDPNFVDKIYCDTVGMSRVGYIVLTQGALSYKEYWLTPLEVCRDNLPVYAEYVPGGLPPPSVSSLYENALDVRGSLSHLRYRYILYKGMLEGAFDWLARLRFHNFNYPESGVDERTWETLLSQGSLVSDLIPLIRNPLLIGYSDTDLLLAEPPLAAQITPGENSFIGLKSMFTIINDRPIFSFKEIGEITRARHWEPAVRVHQTQQVSDTGHNDQSINALQEQYTAHYEQGPVHYHPKATPHSSHARTEEYSPYNPYVLRDRTSSDLTNGNLGHAVHPFYYPLHTKGGRQYLLDDRDHEEKNALVTNGEGPQEVSGSLTPDETGTGGMSFVMFMSVIDPMDIGQYEDLELNYVPNIAAAFDTSIMPPFTGNISAVTSYFDAIADGSQVGDIPIPSPLTPAYSLLNPGPTIEELEEEEDLVMDK